MRSTRSSNNVDHESRRNEYHHSNYHHSSRSSQNHTESNGYGSGGGSNSNHNNNSEHQRSKRPSSTVTNPAASGSSLIKRLKSSPNSSTNGSSINNSNPKEIFINNREHHQNNVKSSSSSLFQKSPSVSNFLMNIDPNECNAASFNGCTFEENQALEGESLIDNALHLFDTFGESAHALRKIVSEVLENKKNGQKKNNGDEGDKKSKVYDSLKTKGLMHLMEMKRLNRIDKYRLKEARQRFNTAKEKVDKIHLQLQNIQYEVLHLQKEQKTCESFRSKDESLELVDCEKFYLSDSVPEDLRHLIVLSKDKKNATLSDASSSEDRHKLHLARLNWELEQRIQHEDGLKQAEESRFRLEVEISARRRTLSQFEPTLRNVIEASKPMVSQLNVPLQVYNTSNYLTPYLPQPLYVLYVQLCAYKGAYGVNYDVSICGTAEEAQEFEKELKKESVGSFFNHIDDDDENNKQQDEDDEDTGHRSKSKARYHHQSSISEHISKQVEGMVNGVDKMDVSADLTENAEQNDFQQKNAKLLQSHPIKVKLMFRYRHYHMIITFTFFTKLEIVGVNYSIENLSNSTIIDPEFSVTNYPSNIFSMLLNSTDTGLKSPNSTIEHILNRYDIDSFDKLWPYIGYAYDWAQRIAGIEFLHPDKRPFLSSGGIIRVSSSIATASLDKTIKAINFRFQARINLQEQILDIYSKKCIDTNKFESLLDSDEMYDDLDKAHLKPKCTIASFARLDIEAFLSEMENFPKKKRQLVEYFDNESDSDSALCDIFDQTNFIFKLNLVSDDTNNNLNATVIVPHNYPQKWPFFILTRDLSSVGAVLGSSSPTYLEPSWLRTLEEHMNVRLPLKVFNQAKKLEETIFPTTLLLRQIYDLQCGLDSIANTQKQLIHKSNQSMEVYSGPKCVNAFLSLSIVQGRDHSLKFV